MENDNKQYIKKIQLSDGSVFWVKDAEAINTSGGTITGDLTVDGKLTAGELAILSIETMEYTPTNVLVEDGGEIKKRSTDNLLQDIGGYSASFDNGSGILELKLGK